jgi:hypothetical protein
VKTILKVTALCGLIALGAHADDPTKPSSGESSTVTEAGTSETKATETREAASSEGEAADAPAATPAAVDLFNLPRRVRAQISYTTKRMLEFDKNKDELLAQDELPKRMQGVIAKGDLDGDGLLSKDELTRMAYEQIQKREAKAEAEPESLEKR